MKRIHFVFLVIFFTSAITLTNCRKVCGCLSAFLKERLQGKTYQVLSVTKGNTDATQEFKDAKIAINSEGSVFNYETATIHSSPCNILVTNIVITTPPTGWATSLTDVKLDSNNSIFEFKVFIQDPIQGGAEHHFKMQKQ